MMALMIAAATLLSAFSARWYLHRSNRREETFLDGHICLTALWNEGAAFALPLARWFIALVSSGSLIFAWCKRRSAPLGAGLLLGGGLSNLYERLRHGKVYDYLRFPKAPGFIKSYVYNLADFAIFIGAILLLFCRKKK